VDAVDPSEGFVAAMRERFPAVRVERASAEALPFPDAAFDRALAQLVVHFMADPVAGIREMARVTRPGGAVAACVWDHAGERGPLRSFWAAAHEVEGDIDDESSLAGTREGHLATLFREAGLRDVTQAALTVRREYPTFDAWWSPYTKGAGPAGAFLARLDEERRDAIRAAAHRRLGDGPIAIEGVAWAARGTA
jgi:SAM-dependent methyltransferase